MVGEVRTGFVGVEVEEEVALAADEVVRGRGTAARYADRLRISEGGFESFVVDGRYAVEAEANPKEN